MLPNLVASGRCCGCCLAETVPPPLALGSLLGTDLVIVGAAMSNCQAALSPAGGEAALSPAGGEAAAAVAVPPGAGRGGFMIRSLSSVLNTHWTVRLAGRDDQNVLGNVDGGGLVVATSPGSETS